MSWDQTRVTCPPRSHLNNCSTVPRARAQEIQCTKSNQPSAAIPKSFGSPDFIPCEKSGGGAEVLPKMLLVGTSKPDFLRPSSLPKRFGTLFGPSASEGFENLAPKIFPVGFSKSGRVAPESPKIFFGFCCSGTETFAPKTFPG